jgi:hypothetical protein
MQIIVLSKTKIALMKPAIELTDASDLKQIHYLLSYVKVSCFQNGICNATAQKMSRMVIKAKLHIKSCFFIKISSFLS